MNREETLALYAQGQEAWNKWANEMLEERKRLEEAGEWQAVQNFLETLEPQNEATKAWFTAAKADFSSEDSPYEFVERVNFSGFVFPSNVNFINAKFFRQVKFINTVFYGNASLNKNTFNEKTIFSNVIFYKDALFEKNLFRKEIIFKDTLFNGETSFHKTIFKADSWFLNLNFKKLASFNKTKFKGGLAFVKAFFSEEIFFKSSSFNDITFFEKTTFYDKAIFEGSIFNKQAKFNNTSFENKALFNKTTFCDIADFKESTFKGIASFENAKFCKSTFFNNAIFKSKVVFNYCHLKNNLTLDNTKFSDKIWLDNSLLETNVRFNNAIFKKNTSFASSTFKGFTNFSKACFYKEANFTSSNFEGGMSLNETKFLSKLPNFIQTHFKEAPRLDNLSFGKTIPPGTWWNSITTPDTGETKARYQALKRLAIQAHDHENEQRFWAGELRSDRSLKTKDNKWNFRPLLSAFWWGNISYGVLSNYGRSIIRPLIAWTIVAAFMAWVHLGGQQTTIPLETTARTKYNSPIKCNALTAAIQTSLKTSALGLGFDRTKKDIYKRYYICLYGTEGDSAKTPKIPNGILIAEFFQMLFSAVLIFLLGLGIRNNFKLK